ncbi:hypothetical protein H6761_00925 [Candidatus Nomurabacteria bacterium]|nr:hypothetical protein [Candidatus Nomurabacteria bacterium]
MPNIHLYVDQRTYHNLIPIIEAVMMTLGLQDDAVITWHGPWSCPISCDGKRTPMPCIGISSTKKDEIRQIIEELKAADINIDCEASLPLPDFIPAEQMRRE